MPRIPRYSSISEAGIDAETQDVNAEKSRKNGSFHPPRSETWLPLSTHTNPREATTRRTEKTLVAEVAHESSEDEEYQPEPDELESWDDHLDDLFAEQEAEGRKNSNGRKDTDYWNVDVIENNVIRRMKLSVNEATAIPPSRQIVLRFNTQLQPIGQAAGLLSGFLGNLGADYTHFPICETSWLKVSKDLKEHSYGTVKRIFHFEEDVKGYIKWGIIQKIGKNWKDTRHKLFHRFYDEKKSFAENVKRKPSGIEPDHWKWFLKYQLKEDTKKKYRQNQINHSKQAYTHTGGSKTLARRKDEEEKIQQKQLSKGDIWQMVHTRKDGLYMHDDARAVGEAIETIQSQDESSKELSANDSLAQVLGKEHPGRVRGVGFGSCPSQILGKTTQQSCSGVQVEQYQKEIAELKAEAAEEKAKRQNMENLLRYLIQQQEGSLPPDVAADLNSLGDAPT